MLTIDGFKSRASCLALLLVLASAPYAPVHSQNTMSPDAEAYFNKALSIIKANSFRRDHVNWDDVTARAMTFASGAQKPVDTYDAIRYVLQQLGDHHSHLRLTPELSKQELNSHGQSKVAFAKGSDNRQSFFAGRTKPESRLLNMSDCGIGILTVPSIADRVESPEATKFGDTLQTGMRDLSRSHLCGWIVDLRGNTGGNMYPMIAGVGPLVGGETLGFFESQSNRSSWFYKDGRVGTRDQTGTEYISGHVSAPLGYVSSSVPVAVLLDCATASAGEATAISFKGRFNTMFFGEKTAGYSTGNSSYDLDDGAVIAVMTATEADRNGKRYDDVVIPDVQVVCTHSPSGDADDPVIQAAAKWIVAKSGHALAKSSTVQIPARGSGSTANSVSATNSSFSAYASRSQVVSLRSAAKGGNERVSPLILSGNWQLTGSDKSNYQVGTMGGSGGFLKSVSRQLTGFGATARSVNAQSYIGKRIKFSARLKTFDMHGAAGLWLRLDAADGHMLKLDNMSNRMIDSSKDWGDYSCVLDVPEGTSQIVLGTILMGSGDVFFDGAKLEVVDSSVPLTVQ